MSIKGYFENKDASFWNLHCNLQQLITSLQGKMDCHCFEYVLVKDLPDSNNTEEFLKQEIKLCSDLYWEINKHKFLIYSKIKFLISRKVTFIQKWFSPHYIIHLWVYTSVH